MTTINLPDWLIDTGVVVYELLYGLVSEIAAGIGIGLEPLVGLVVLALFVWVLLS